MDNPYARTVGHIDELLVMIFSYLDDRSLSRVACVSKHWSDIALDCLWHEVSDIRRALTVLAPLSLKSERPTGTSVRPPNAYAFKRSLTPADWQRFQRYSKRVRRLRHDQRQARPSAEREKRHLPLHSKVFDELSASCPYPNSDIFPNLQSLTWFSCDPARQEYVLTFMHSRVKHLGLQLYRSDPPSSTTFLEQVCARCSGVTSLELRLNDPVRHIEVDVLVLLHGLHELQQVSLPIFTLTPRIFTELSRLKHLVTISVGHPAQAQPGNREDVAQYTPTLPQDGFSTLRDLAFSSQIPHATLLLKNTIFPTRLTQLHLKNVTTASPVELRDFFCVVRDRCTSLRDLSVDYIIAPDSPLPLPPPPPEDRLNIAVFRPLFSSRSLRIFEFRWDYALNLTDDDMEEFASNWRSLESLQLNPEPVPDPHGPKLSLHALIPFARYCTNLRYLALHIDAREPPEPSCLCDSNIPRFPRLDTLAVGLSVITKAEPVTLFLSQLLPLGCHINCGLRWPDAFDFALERALVPLDVRTELSAFWMRWTEVAKLLPIATKARLEEQARFATLERQMQALEVSRSEDRRRLTHLEQEVEDLRSRTGSSP
ncbi:hypothetical protein C8Q70DRAFT_922142 [Cubamyces menziesii]|uniref:F-box domain-containing protein n=1 Tax=Trametes cubensis TaxID=1111947 RepID=A0AAD7TWJ9_9APHY|nr:hypothetical protein C8Q70DRAFT_922142 [Cubamyces menziesii]KAJ8487645.1 hypothetical protein ONZ51_g4052 [Trametes cubensis]